MAAEYLSVDGRMTMEDPEGREQERGGWTAPYWNDELERMQRDLLFASDALVLGRVTYEGFAQAWPSITDEAGFADRMNSLPKHVASTTLSEPLDWNATLLGKDVVGEVRRLKEGDGGNLLVYGSGRLVRSLLADGVIDELRLMIHPVVLGWGQRLLEDAHKAGLTLTDSVATEKGVVALTYQLESAGTSDAGNRE